MQRLYTKNATGVAPDGRWYAGDINALQDAVAAITDLTQAFSTGSIAIGESGLQIVRYGAGEASLSGALRTSGILRALGGLFAGQFTTTQRDALASTLRPYGLLILNTSSNRLEINLGTDIAPAWIGLGAVINRGAIGARPTAAASNQNTLYFATDDQGGTLYYSDGAVWTKIGRGLTEQITAGMVPNGLITDAMLAGSIAPAKVLGTAVVNADSRLSDQRTPLDNSVTAAKIVDGQVGTAELADGGVTNAKIASGIDAGKISGLQTSLPFQKAVLASDIPMVSAGTVYDAAQLTLGAGTWQVDGYVAVFSGTATSVIARLWDGSTIYRTGSTEVGINTSEDTIPVSDILVLGGSATIRLAATTDHSGVASIKAKDNSGTGTITYLNAVKIA